jgi:hypothetical protein
MLPFKLFYSLEELANYKWWGVSSADEIIHMAAIGIVPVYKIIGFNSFCYYSTYQRFFEEHSNAAKCYLEAKDDSISRISAKKLTECVSSFFNDYCEPMAQVPPYTLLGMIFDRVSESTTSHLLGPSAGTINSRLLKLSEYEDMAIVEYDPEEDFTPKPINIKFEELVIPSSVLEGLESDPPDTITVEYNPTIFNNAVAPQLPTTVLEATIPKLRVGEILETWKEIANYIDCSVSTAQRRYKSVVRVTETGTVLTTKTEIDEFRIKTATKKKRKKY